MYEKKIIADIIRVSIADNRQSLNLKSFKLW